ncbi:carbohydrate sulfotransferase 5 [Teleopsis dalmanni]|uniref:carbohydrate sulfotransferase 5 n=1 Tax=Teleopsis dalmanni TaxID=139649 RepID=UPI0018CC93DD|nr:carbohydrate sulfotransferase 5 [Teleopsis dalmanni]
MSSSATTDPAVPLLNGEPIENAASVRTRAQKRISLTTKRRKLSRRANLIGICGVSSLCILLLIATAQHRPLPTSVATSSGSIGGGGGGGVGGSDATGFATSGGIGGAANNERHIAFNVQPQTLNVYNLSATISDVLTAQRSKILIEMENFEYPSGRFGVDADKLTDLTPESGGMPVRSLVVTTWRSGSTFLGDILNAMPGNFYHYEPLLNFGIKQVRDPEESEMALQNLKHLLNCDYSYMEDYLDYGKSHTYLFEHNERLWCVCKEFPHFCWRAKFLTPFCKLFPMQSMKTVRLRLSLAEELLKDDSLNVRIILLVRDPRGTMQSRKHRVWCAGNPDCDDPSFVCEDLVSDYKSAEILLDKYPSRFRTLRYEDLSINPYEMTQEVLQFYGLPFDPMVEEFLDTHTKVNIGGVSSTYRDSKSAPFHWKQDLKIEEIKHIQQYCTEAMALWGYRKIENFTDYHRVFDPIILPPPLA